MDIPHPNPNQKPVSDILWYSLRSPSGPTGSVRIQSKGMSSVTGEVDIADSVDRIQIPIAAITATDEEGEPLLPVTAAAYYALLAELPKVVEEWGEKGDIVLETINPVD